MGMKVKVLDRLRFLDDSMKMRVEEVAQEEMRIGQTKMAYTFPRETLF